MKVDVRLRHIKKGTPRLGSSCPIAQSLIEAGMKNVSVGTFQASFTCPNGKVVKAPLPPSAQTFVKNFDSAKKVAPISFDIAA